MRLPSTSMHKVLISTGGRSMRIGFSNIQNSDCTGFHVLQEAYIHRDFSLCRLSAGRCGCCEQRKLCDCPSPLQSLSPPVGNVSSKKTLGKAGRIQHHGQCCRFWARKPWNEFRTMARTSRARNSLLGQQPAATARVL